MSIVVDFFRSQLESAAGPLVVIDVGVSGGIDPRWRQFGSVLRAIGFDPRVREIERLIDLEDHLGVEYRAAFLTGPDERARPTRLEELPFQRSSAVRAIEIMEIDYAQEFFDAAPEPVWAEDRHSIDEILPALSVPWVDVLKIDTDGYDFLILAGAEKTIDRRNVLAVQVEIQFHGLADERSNTFANIDRYLRQHAFRLFDLAVYRYSRAALPQRFLYRIPAQTTAGPVEWGDAVYLRDPIGLGNWGTDEPDVPTLIRLACLYDVFGLPDCTAELVSAYSSHFTPWCDIERLLDLLAPTNERYRDYVRHFEADPTMWYPA